MPTFSVPARFAPRIREMTRSIPGILSGRLADTTGLVRGLHMRVGVAALSVLKEAFIVKARGGTDEAGIKWAPLSPITLARRRHPDLIRSGPSWRRPLLTADQDALWRATFRWALRKTDQNKGHAAAIAWVVTKAAGGKTIRGVVGNLPYEIGRDTDIMFNSLSPTADGPGPLGIIRPEPGAVVIGTTVPYAKWFHHGTRRQPARPIWPARQEQWPANWLADIRDVWVSGAKKVVEALVAQVVNGAG